LTFNRLRGFSPGGTSTTAGALAGMAGETDDPEDAAARLEAALERIARYAGSPPARDPPPSGSVPGAGPEDAPADMTGAAASVEEIAARLDGLIDRLRAALNTSSGGRPG
jgi:hypothetical protein